MEFEAWYSEVVRGLAEETGGILAVNQHVKDAHASGYTPGEFIRQTLMELEQAQDEYDAADEEE